MKQKSACIMHSNLMLMTAGYLPRPGNQKLEL